MDNLQHIDDLLKKSASSFEYAEVGANDWLAVENKLKQRKKRIYALWFFLALVFVSSSVLLINNTSSDKAQPLSINKTQNKEVDKLVDNTNKDSELLNQQIKTESDLVENLSSNQPQSDVSFNKSQTTIIIPSNIRNPEGSKSQSSADNLTDQAIASSQSIATPQSNYSPIAIENTIDKTDIISIPEISEEETNTGIDKDIVIAQNSAALTKSDANTTSGTKNKKNHTKGHWEAGLSFTPSISNKRISENSLLAGLIHVNYYDKAASSEKSSFSNSAGINAQYHLPNGIFIATGAFVSQRTEAVNYDYSIDSVPINNNNVIAGYKPQTPVPIKYNGSNSYHFMEIPLNIGYKTSISTNFEIRSQVGMSYLFLFNQKGKKADFNDLSLKDVTDFALNKNNMAANAKVGVYWNKKHFTIGAEPTFSLNLNNLNVKESSAIIVKPYSYGFNISTNYKFIK